MQACGQADSNNCGTNTQASNQAQAVITTDGSSRQNSRAKRTQDGGTTATKEKHTKTTHRKDLVNLLLPLRWWTAREGRERGPHGRKAGGGGNLVIPCMALWQVGRLHNPS